jgi:ParB family chromosome partitioning protein
MIHRLKTTQPYFGDVKNGSKTFELRKHDRDFRVGDFLELQEWDGTAFTGDRVTVCISYFLSDGKAEKFGLQPGYCVLGLGAIAQ